MKILAIETSCDETAIAILDASGDEQSATFKLLGNALLSQIDIHKEYGGVYPMVAKREHARNLVPLLEASLEEAELLHESVQELNEETKTELGKILEREPGLAQAFIAFMGETERPAIDAIAVTHGPGLEPALWVGVNFAKALSLAWNMPVVPINHMEGHLLSALAKKEDGTIVIKDVEVPVLGLLISGGHTELVLMKEWLTYEVLGQTRDDAVGEAFDKVARMLDLPYPGGPEISRLAEEARSEGSENPFTLPRPMIDTKDFDFSFSGLKTAVLYTVKGKEFGDSEKKQLAHAFEDAAADVLTKKSVNAVDATGARTFVVGGGVSANTHIRRKLEEALGRELDLRIPEREFTTDNAVMIGIAGFYRARRQEFSKDFRADGTLTLG